MSAKKKPSEGDDSVYRVKHISRSAWEDGRIDLPGLSPADVNEFNEDEAARMAMTGEIPLELIREMLKRQEQDQGRAQTRKAEKTGQGPISPEDIEPGMGRGRHKPKAEIAEELPTPEEIEAAKREMRAMKAKSRLPEPEAEAEELPKAKKVKKAAEPKPPKPVKEARLPKPVKEQKTKEIKPPKAPKAPKEPRQRGEDRVPWFTWTLNTVRLYFLAEEQRSDVWDDTTRLYSIPLRPMLWAMYRSLYFFGLRFARPIQKFRRFSTPYVMHPILALWHFVRAAVLLLHHLTIGRLQRALARAKTVHVARKQNHAQRSGFAGRVKDFAEDYAGLLRAAANTLMPVGAAVVVLLVIQGVAGRTYALGVTYNDNPLGYIATERVFLEAQAAANRHMDPAEEAELDQEQFEAVAANKQVYAQFELTRVQPEDLTSADLLCDQLLESSPNEMTSACGIYITGESGQRQLVATIKNSTDATSVLESIKTAKTSKLNIEVKAGDTVGFVQQIDLVPGFYPRSQMIDAQALLQKIGGTVKGEVRVPLKEGDTLIGLANDNGITYAELLRLNPEIVGMETRVKDGTQLLVSQEVGYLQVKVVRTEKRMEEVKFSTEKKDNYSLYQGENRVKVKGVNGEEQILERVTYINGVRTGEVELLSRTRTKEPVTEIREVGKKSTRISTGDGGYITINPSAMGFTWPVPACHRISSNFGYRNGRLHQGIDIADGSTYGKTIVAAKDGTVEKLSYGTDAYGYYVLINHGNGVKTRYAHMIANSFAVRVGEQVTIGQPIGLVGNTGRSTGPHLHFEVIINGTVQNPRNYVNP